MALLLYQNALLWTGTVCKPIIELKDFIYPPKVERADTVAAPYSVSNKGQEAIRDGARERNDE